MNPTSEKRSRADILRELKEKRGSLEGVAPAKAQEESVASANVSAKFKPIGFKPIGAAAEEKAKKKKKVKAQDGEGAERKKKRRKVEKGEGQKGEMGPPAVPIKDPPSTANAPSSTTTVPTVQKPDMGLQPMDEDLDIFAGAGEYEGIDLGDDDDDDNNDGGEGRHREASPADEGPSTAISGRKWFDDTPQPEQPKSSTEIATQAKVNSPPPPPPDLEEGEEETPMRLVPLASSAVPSISDLLAMDEAAEKETKRKARKEKKKGKGGGGDKLDRDYQRWVRISETWVRFVDRCVFVFSRLKSYEAKKAAS